MDGLVFICSLIICVVAGYVYLIKEDNDYAKLLTQTSHHEKVLTAFEVRLQETTGAQNKFNESATSMIQGLASRMQQLEEKKAHDGVRNMNLRLHEPIEVNLVYPNATPPLLKKAGIKPVRREN